MAILSWRISWITTSRSVMSPRSTNGRAPSINSSMRFWMRAVSLNRPPTLFTISSLLRASIMFLKFSGFLVSDEAANLGDRPAQIIVDHHVVKRAASLGHVDLALGRPEPPGDVVGGVSGPASEPLQ